MMVALEPVRQMGLEDRNKCQPPVSRCWYGGDSRNAAWVERSLRRCGVSPTWCRWNLAMWWWNKKHLIAFMPWLKWASLLKMTMPRMKMTRQLRNKQNRLAFVLLYQQLYITYPSLKPAHSGQSIWNKRVAPIDEVAAVWNSPGAVLEVTLTRRSTHKLIRWFTYTFVGQYPVKVGCFRKRE